MTIERVSLDLAGQRRTQLTAALVLAVLALVAALVAVIGGSSVGLVVSLGTILTGAALVTSLRSWRGATEVWSGRGSPDTLPGLVRRSILPSLPALLVSVGVGIGVTVAPASRFFSSPPPVGKSTWTDGVLLLSVLLYVAASAGAALYPLRVRR